MLPLLVHHIECDGQRVDVGVIIVVDNSAVVDASLDLESHGYGSQAHQSFVQNLYVHLHQEADRNAMDGILDGGLVDKGDGETQGLTLILQYK